MKKQKVILFIILIIAINVVPIAIGFWASGMLDLVNKVFGHMFWVGVAVFIAFIIGSIFFGMKLAKKALQPKTLKNGLPATATVIKSYQGNMRISLGGVLENYQLIIEVNVRNPQGETWKAKITEMINITQIGVFQPGVSFNVLYAPNDHCKVVLGNNKHPNY